MGQKSYCKVEVNNPCICCNATVSDLFMRTRFVQYPGAFDYRKCCQCGFVFNSPRLADLSVLYEKDYFFFQKNNVRMRNHVLCQLQRLVLPAEPYAPGKRLIELGSSRGHLLSTLQQIGYDVQGVEPSMYAVAETHAAYQLPIFEGTAEQYLKTSHPRDFDIALACTVIEHVNAPDVFVDACASLLKLGGVLIMDMPNIDSFNAHVAGPAWDMYQKYHLSLFSPSTIILLLKRHRFNIIRMFSYNNYPPSKRRIRDLKNMRRGLLFLDKVGLYSELTSCRRNTNHHAALQAFAIFTFTLCSTWFVMTRNRSACCS